MKRILWLTDIHLNFVDEFGQRELLENVASHRPDAVLISGDIAEAHSVVEFLERIDEEIQRPLYFVLGNHDFYFGSISQVRSQVRLLCERRQRLHYLTDSDPLPLGRQVGIVGHDGWADARIGDYERSLVMMNDYRLITELAGVGKQQRWPLLKALGDASAAHIREVLPRALQAFRHVFLVTHVPPWRDACWHEGRISDDEWAPHFTCQAMGEVILEIMRAHPKRELTVLCGHTHGQGQATLLHNVTVITGGAMYGQPEIAKTFVLPD